MTFWILLWKVCLIGTLALFIVMALVVTVGGFLDVKALLRRLAEQPHHDRSPEGGNSSG